MRAEIGTFPRAEVTTYAGNHIADGTNVSLKLSQTICTCSVPTSPTFRQNGWDERGIDMGEIVKYHRPTCIVQFVQLGFNVFLTGRTF